MQMQFRYSPALPVGKTGRGLRRLVGRCRKAYGAAESAPILSLNTSKHADFIKFSSYRYVREHSTGKETCLLLKVIARIKLLEKTF